MQEPLRVKMQNHDVMHALLGPLCSANTVVQSKAALMVATTACDVEARTEVRALITFVLSVFLVPISEWINSKHFQVFEPTHHLDPSKLGPHFNHGLWVIIMCQRMFISCNKCTSPVGVVDNGRAAPVWGLGVGAGNLKPL